MKKIPFLLLLVSFCLSACQNQQDSPSEPPSEEVVIVEEEPKVDNEGDSTPPSVEEDTPPPKPDVADIPHPTPPSSPDEGGTPKRAYAWLTDYDQATALVHRFAPPEGYNRVQAPAGGYAHWLRHLPLKPAGSPVLYYYGGTKPNRVHEAVVSIDVGDKDLQQCADAVMRLKAEYHYQKKDYGNIHFNFTSGHKVSFDDWRKGRKPRVKGNSVTFSGVSGKTDNSYKNFKKYMNMIFNYAGTASLTKELAKVAVKDIRPGDVFIQGGFPGHAVLVVDVAENASGDKVFMLAQSYMPAQDIHILKNPQDAGISPWYKTDFGETLQTPEWSFNRGDLKRFK